MSKLKSGVTNSASTKDINPIEKYFEVGKESSNVGTCLTWRVYDAYRKSDGKVNIHCFTNINYFTYTKSISFIIAIL